MRRSEVVIMDMDAGVEHLGRGTAQFVDAFLVVVEPGQRSVGTARAVQALARDLGIKHCLVVGSKVRGEADKQFIRESLPDMEILGFIDYHPELANADREGMGAYQSSPAAAEQVRKIKDVLENLLTKA
ncbi:MAG: Cobyrinic acid ac-diamide synthase [Dehalococcoidia bacterium]|nr:Cobyrinic acid ac-diamide synthase [Dehalococcoidia bacterium]